MFSAPVICLCTGRGTDSELLIPASRAAAVNSAHRVSSCMLRTWISSPALAASRQGPHPSSYCRSSRASATSPLNAAVLASSPRMRVTEMNTCAGSAFLARLTNVSRIWRSGRSPDITSRSLKAVSASLGAADVVAVLMLCPRCGCAGNVRRLHASNGGVLAGPGRGWSLRGGSEPNRRRRLLSTGGAVATGTAQAALSLPPDPAGQRLS